MHSEAKPSDVAWLTGAWEKALAVWGLAIHVDLPTLDKDSEALAYIDLSTRKVVVNPAKLDALQAADCLEAVLAHELGHHLRYPGSLSTQAKLELLEREILPVKSYSLLNLFTDFLINTELGADRAMQAQLARIYQGMPATHGAAEQDPAFYFYLTCFEEAWIVPPHTLTREAGKALERQFPGCRAEAQLLAQELPNLAPNLFTQFLYFASVVSRYQVFDPEKAQQGQGKPLNPTHGDHSEPAAGDYADALKRSAQESEAIRRAIKEGWLKPETIPDANASETIRAGALPGVLAGEPKKLAEAMALHYRRLAEQYLVKPPDKKRTGEPMVPTTLSPWEIGTDAPKDIDWIGSILAGGAELGTISPLKRDMLAEDPGTESREWRARLEIYLDVSGSMPDPKARINPMTLAAQVLCMSAIRAGGQCRALIYSTNNIQHWVWTRSELEISRFLMNYIGGGTDFPFDILHASVAECAWDQPVRVVLTDSDFSHNLNTRPQKNPAEVRAAAEKMPFIALLNGATSVDDAWVKTIAAAGARVVPVASMEKFPAIAAALGDALFGDAAPPPRPQKVKK